MVFPDEIESFKTYSIPRTLPFFTIAISLLLFTGLLVFSVISFTRSITYKDQDSEVTRLRQIAVQQNIQLYAFADKVHQLEQEMAKLHQYDRKLRAMTGSETLFGEMANLDMGGSEGETTLPQTILAKNTKSLVRQMHRHLDSLLTEAGLLEQNQHILGKYLEDSRSILASTPDDWPLVGPITSFFGYRKSPFGKEKEFHRGLDISAAEGTPIKAPADGIVIDTEWNSGYGLILSINHGYGLVSRYAHLYEALCEPGQRISRGQKIALVGASGRTTGPHLHYETILNGVPVNPMRYFAAQ